MPYTHHGHYVANGPLKIKPQLIARCGGPGLCTPCATDVGQAAPVHTEQPMPTPNELAELRADLDGAEAELAGVDTTERVLTGQRDRARFELAGLRERAVEVEKYWRDWPSERRAKVHALSQFLAGAIEALAVEVESWRAAPEPIAPTQAPVALERDPDAPSSVEAPEPATPPKVDYCGRCGVVRVKLSDGTCTTCAWKNHPLPEPAAPADREWHLCHNAGSHHITDTFHGNDCDRPEHWDEVEQGETK